MPKRIQIFFKISIALVSLLFVFSCSSGDEATVERTSVTDVITGNNPVGPSSGGFGGGGGGTGACVLVNGPLTTCFQELDMAVCNAYNTSFSSGTFHAGQSCESLGYTDCWYGMCSMP